jgi:hypothetical protein
MESRRYKTAMISSSASSSPRQCPRLVTGDERTPSLAMAAVYMGPTCPKQLMPWARHSISHVVCLDKSRPRRTIAIRVIKEASSGERDLNLLLTAALKGMSI